MDFLAKYIPGNLTEWIIVLLGLIFFIGLSFALGKSRTTAFNLSFYPAILIYFQLPDDLLNKLIIFNGSPWQTFLNNFAIFLVFFFLTFVIINAITGKSLIYSGRRKSIQLLVLGVCALFLVLIVLSQIVVLPKIVVWLPTLYPFFSSEKLFFWLLSAPIVLMLIFVRK